MRRILTAAVLVPLVVVVVLWAPMWLFALLIVVVALLGLREFYDLAEAQGCSPYRWIGFVAAAAIVLWSELPWVTAVPLATTVLLACVLAILARALGQPEHMHQSIANAGATLLGALYLGLLMGATGAIRWHGVTWFFFLLAVVWLGDTAALYVGKSLGRTAMAPRISPHKTWEGAVASLVVAALVGAGLGQWTGGERWELALLAVGMNIAAQTGDLVESLLKRGAQVKDSGALLPGHGGMLDRIDAMLFAAPILWYYLVFFRA